MVYTNYETKIRYDKDLLSAGVFYQKTSALRRNIRLT